MPNALEIERLQVARVPMHRPFAHASHTHARTQSVLLTLRLDGVTGWGEGAPRPYVTGETVETACRALRSVDPTALRSLLDVRDFAGSVGVLSTLDFPRLVGGVGRAPAAAAALEIALLDALCRWHGKPMSAVLDACEWASGIRMDAEQPRLISEVVDLSRTPEEQWGALSTRARDRLGHIKLKALDTPEETAERAQRVRDLVGPKVGISVDANGGWAPGAAVEGAALLRRTAGVDWIEEPTVARDWSTLRRIEDCGMPVMLDESGIDCADVDFAAATGAASLVNIRVSKCGGVFASLRTVLRARERGMRVQLGVQVGEVGPLWSVGRMLAARLTDLVAIESGRQDEWFPTALTSPSYTVDRDALLAPTVPGPGHGLTPAESLKPHCAAQL